MPAYSYTAREVGWLLSLNGEHADHDGEWISGEEQARQLDEESLERTGHWGAGDESGLPVIARWHDVRRAQRQVVDRKADRLLAQRLDGATEQQVADRNGLSQQTVNRKVRARLAEILAELADPRVDEEMNVGPDGLPLRVPDRSPICLTGGCHGRAVRLAALITERWVLAGRQWDASRGRALQRWHTRQGDVLVPRPLARAEIGAAYDALFVVGKTNVVERLGFRRRTDCDLMPRDPHVGQWKRATAAAEKGDPPPNMTVLPRVPMPSADVAPERQTRSCEQHLLPELRVRILREKRWPA